MRALIIEDETKTASYLCKGLTESGFVVDTASDGEDGLHQALENAYDVIVCDVMLPRMDGWAIVSRLRERGVATPTLLLTARDAVPDRVRGLELGADDYLVKPFAFSELLARIRTVLRRGGSRPLETYQAADVEVDIVRHRATRSGRELNLSPKEFALLSLFVRRAGEVLSRTIIAEQVWDMNFDSDTNVVDVARCSGGCARGSSGHAASSEDHRGHAERGCRTARAPARRRRMACRAPGSRNGVRAYADSIERVVSASGGLLR